MKTALKQPWVPPAVRRLLGEFRGQWATIGVVLVLGAVISAVQPASVKLTQLIVDHLQQAGGGAFPAWLPLSLVGLFVLSGLAKYVYNVIRRNMSERILARLRAGLFDTYLHLPMTYLDSHRTGELLSGIQYDLQQINQGFETFWDVLKEPLTFLGLIGAAFYFDWRLTLVVLLVLPFVVGVFSLSGAAVKRYTSRNLSQYSDLVSLCQEALIGARVVRVFGLEQVLREKFAAIQGIYLRTIGKSIRVQELSTPMVELIGAGLMAGVIVYGANRAAEGQMTAGDLVAFIIALGLAQMPIKKLNNANLKMKAAEAAAERIYGLLDAPRTQPGAVDQPAVFSDSIEFRDVGLSYGDQPALSGVSFTLRRGECVALVGQSGGGKTSIVNLIARLYEVSSGAVLLDGRDIREMPLAKLRGLLSYVTQDVFLFHDTVYENIRFGRPDATREEVEAAAERAHCKDFIGRLAQGWGTVIGDRGMRLSGGERQRIAIARAFLRGAPILLLDEATSSLDSDSEAVVQTALTELMRGRTALVVAHRLSTIKNSDRILVVQGGRIEESGTHDALIAAAGLYQSLFSQQAWGATTPSA